jgi:hypothetical protein
MRADLIRSMSHALLPGQRILGEDPAYTEGSERGSGPGSGASSFSSGTGGSLSRFGGPGGVDGGSFFNLFAPVRRGPTRKFKTSMLMGVRLLFRFMWPLFLLLAFYVGMWRYEDETSGDVATYKRDSLFFGQVDALIAQANHAVRGTLLHPDPLKGACNATALVHTGATIDALTATINAYQDAVLFGTGGADGGTGSGSSSLSNPDVVGTTVTGYRAKTTLSTDPTLQAIMLTNGCAAPGMPADCTSRAGFYHGLLSDGLQAALREYNLLARHAVQLQEMALAQSAAQGSACPLLSPTEASLASLDAMASVYLRAAFVYVVSLVSDLAKAEVSAFITGHAVLTALSVLLIASLYFLFVKRAITKMDRDIKRTRGTLLLFPTDVLAGVAAFVQMSGTSGISADLGAAFGSRRRLEDDDDDDDEEDEDQAPARGRGAGAVGAGSRRGLAPPPQPQQQPRARPNLIGRMR